MNDLRLIVFAGRAGVGKSTLASTIAKSLGAFYLGINAIEDGIRQSALQPVDVMDAGYRTAWKLAAENLWPGHSVMCDGVDPVSAVRCGWRNSAIAASARLGEVEIRCSDLSAYRARAKERNSRAPPEMPSWADARADIGNLSPHRTLSSIQANLRGKTPWSNS